MNNADPLIDMQVEDFPAPVCNRCAVVMWVNKRVDCSTAARAERLSYQCRICHTVLRVGHRARTARSPRSAAS